MTQLPGTIHLGKFRLVYQEEREPGAEGDEGYLLQQCAVIRLNEQLAKIARPEDYTVLCDEANFTKELGKRPSALQYFIASIAFCMFSQLARFAAKFAVAIEDAAIELRMTYDLRAKMRLAPCATAARSLTYLITIKSATPMEQVIRVAQSTDQGCHTVNSLRKRVPVSGKLRLNEQELWIND